MAKNKRQIEYRHYDMPNGHFVLPLLGEKWEIHYSATPVTLQHFHNYMEIGYCYWGEGTLEIENTVYHYSGKEISFIPQNIAHTTTSKEGGICKWEFLFFDVEGFIKEKINTRRISTDEMIKKINQKARVVKWEENEVLAAAVRIIIEEYRHRKSYYKHIINDCLSTIVYELLRDEEEVFDSEETDHEKNNIYIDESVKYIKNHFGEDLKVADIAEHCGLSESYFRKTFEDVMSMRPMDYVNMVRIDKACSMLEEDNYSVEEVGIRVGYMTPSTFTRNFKKITGQAPLKWKKEAPQKDGIKKNYTIVMRQGW